VDVGTNVGVSVGAGVGVGTRVGVDVGCGVGVVEGSGAVGVAGLTGPDPVQAASRAIVRIKAIGISRSCMSLPHIQREG